MAIIKEREEHIEANICEYLILKGASLDKIISEWYYNKEKEIYQTRKSNFTNRGIADIIGVYQGMYFAIEVKNPSEMEFFDLPIEELKKRYIDAQRRNLADSTVKKHLRALEQKLFIDDKVRAWGIAFFASSIKEVQEGFREFNVII